MTWGLELWDQFDLIANHTSSGIDFVEKVAKFVKERCEIESRYARDLRQLVKKFNPKKKEDEHIFTFQKAFIGVVKETDDVAGQHELISESLTEKIWKELHLLHNELKTERRKHLSDGKKVQEQLEQSIKAMEVSKRAYMKASEEAEQALQAFQKADQDMANSRLQIEKHKNISVEKGQACERAKDEYRNQLQQTNSKQALHYSNEMPAVFDELQKMDERRIKRTGELLEEYANVEAKVMPIIQKCLDNMKDNGKSVNGQQDSKLLCDQHKTEYKPPQDIQFEEYGSKHTLPRQPASETKGKKGKSIFTGNKKKKKNVDNGLDGNDQTLTPGQKIRTSKKKVQQLEAQVAQLKNSREGMEKMIDVYRQNPSLGDPATIEQNLSDNAKELDALNVDLHRYQCYLAALENRDAPPPPEVYSKTSSSQSPPAPSSSVPDGAPSNVPPPPEPAPAPAPAPAPPPAMLVPPVEEDDEFEEDEPHCRVIYDFQATNDGELTVVEGDELVVLEQDTDNSGWTKVLKDDEEGYVPSTYIEYV